MIFLCAYFFALQRSAWQEKTFLNWMLWENSRKWTKRFCILTGFGKSCGAVQNFYFKFWKQQLQLWLKAKRGKWFKKQNKTNQLSLEEVCSVLISSCASGPLVCFLWFWHFANTDFHLSNKKKKLVHIFILNYFIKKPERSICFEKNVLTFFLARYILPLCSVALFRYWRCFS